MIGDLLSIGERLAGEKEPQLKRGLAYAVAEAVAVAVPLATVLLFVRRALSHSLSMTEVWRMTLAIAVAVVLRALLAIRSMGDLFGAAHTLMGKVRIRLADFLRKLPMGFFSGRRSGELASVLTTDVALVEDIWSHLLGVFAATLILPLVVGAALCVLDVRLGLILFATLPAALLALAITTPIFMRRIGAVIDASAEANGRLVEYAQGIAVLRAFGRQGEGYGRLARSMERLRDALIAAEVGPAPLLGVYGFVVEGGFVLTALMGVSFMRSATLDPATFLVFLVVSAGVTRQLSDLGVSLLVLRAAQKAMQRIEGLFAEPQLAEPKQAGRTPARFDVTLDELTFGYEERAVLERVSLTFPERSLTALVGPSGSGKSTLVHLVARLWDVPTGNGSIRIGDVDIRDMRFEDLHHHVAMVFQDVVLFTGSVADNIKIGKMTATLDEVIAAAKSAQAHDFIMALPDGYDTELGEGGNSLSGGEKQRISIARALLKDAPIVLLDEATASVDVNAEAAIQRAIDVLVRDKTVVVIAHRLRTVQRASRIVVLEAGRVVEQGTHAALIEHGGTYFRLWNEQQRAAGWRLTT